MGLCFRTPIFAISLVLLSSLNAPVSVLRPETWDFIYSVPPCPCHDCTEFGTDGRCRLVEGEKEWRKQQAFWRETPLPWRKSSLFLKSLGFCPCHCCRITGRLGSKKMKKPQEFLCSFWAWEPFLQEGF